MRGPTPWDATKLTPALPLGHFAQPHAAPVQAEHEGSLPWLQKPPAVPLPPALEPELL